MSPRRRFLVRLGATAALLARPALSNAVQRASLADPLRLAADDALAESGLASALQRGFGRDTGVAVEVLHGPASEVLRALERGEHDVALTNAPALEASLEKEGLVYDRRLITRSDFLIVGPSVLARPLSAGHDMVQAAGRLAQANAPFLGRHDGSGSHLAELALWSAAHVAPGEPWYHLAASGQSVLAQARHENACTVVERGVWSVHPGGKGYGVLAAGDPRFTIEVHVMRSFRVQHPAGKLFVEWIASPKGRRLAAAHRGYRAG